MLHTLRSWENFSTIINTLLPTLLEMLHAGRLKLFAEASQLFMHDLLQFVVARNTASSESIVQGPKKMGVGRY